MSSKNARDDDQDSNTPRVLNRKSLMKKLGDIKLRYHEIEKELKSLNLKVPDKEFFIAQKNEDVARLNDVKCRRENQFKDKRIVDIELREVNQQVQIKYDAVGKLKSTLKYKSSDRVDDVIRKLEGQLQKLQMKPNEERRIRQEILKLEESKAKIKDYLEAEEEIKQLKEKQKNIRERRDENVKRITAVKQEESAARSLQEQHRKAEDEVWTIYKENLAKRVSLRNEKDELLKQKKEANEEYRKGQSSRRELHFKRESLSGLQAFLLNEPDARTKDPSFGTTRIRTERKRPYEDEINLCKLLLAYLEKHESQASSTESSSVETKEAGLESGRKENEKLVPDEGIYRGVRRKPSKRERRRKQHVGEANRKLEHHFTVVKQFISLGVQPPATIAEIPAAERAIREKKRLRECQRDAMDTLTIERAKLTPYLANISSLEAKDSGKSNHIDSSDTFVAESVSKDDMSRGTASIASNLGKKHKSCPSLPGAVQLAELESPYPSPANNISASNSEYEPDSPTSLASSASITADEKQRSVLIEDGFDFTDSKVASIRHFKGQHRVHFATEITEVPIVLGTVNGKYGEEFGNTVTSLDGGISCFEDMPNSPVRVGELKPNVEHHYRSNAIVMHCDFDRRNHELNYQPGSHRQHANNYADNYVSGDDEKSEGRDFNTAIEYGNELQFEIDDFPSRPQNQLADNRYSKPEKNNTNNSSSEEYSNETDNLNALQFPMDGRTDDAPGQRFGENFALYQRSPGSCSPRRANEYIYVDKEDSVEVST